MDQPSQLSQNQDSQQGETGNLLVQEEQKTDVVNDTTKLQEGNVSKQGLKPEDLITQREQPDVSWKSEMPNTIPNISATTKSDLRARKHLDQVRWACVQRPSLNNLSLIAVLTSCYNYLFSFIGGSGQARPPLSQMQVCEILAVDQQRSDQGELLLESQQVLQYFERLCASQKVASRAEVLFKVRGNDWTPQRNDQQALDVLMQDNAKQCFVYRSFDTYLFVVGYEIVPTRPLDAYKRLADIEPKNLIYHLFLAETDGSKRIFWQPSWQLVCRDLSLAYPKYYNFREPWMEEQLSTNASHLEGGRYFQQNESCLLAFYSLEK